MGATEMDGMSPSQEGHFEWGHSDYFRTQILHCLSEPVEIVRFRQDNQVCIAAKLCCAVENARLAAHEQTLNVARLQSQKDFANRVRGQENLLP
jgi:hypothetical protein